MSLGTQVHTALEIVGITPERIEQWLGRPCHCEERQRKLDAIGSWAFRVTSGKLYKAKEYLLEIIDG